MPSTVTVTNLTDVVNGNTSSIAALMSTQGADGISLREALTAANNTPGADTIDFAVTGTITLTSGQLLLKSDAPITITGPGAGLLSISGNNTSRVFFNNSAIAAPAELSGLTITGGRAGDGGGVQNFFGTLTLTNCTISGNTSGGNGGGVANFGTALTLTNCTVSGNSISSGFGGGVYNAAGKTATLTNCTVSGNSVTSGFGPGLANDGTLTLTNCTVSGNTFTGYCEGGGLYLRGGTATLTNCTVSGNNAWYGGGLANFATATLNNCTVSGNSATTSGGGVYNGGASLKAGNTILAGNTAPSGPDAYGSTISSQGNNLIGKTNDSFGWVASDLKGTSAAPINPLLGALTNNGGPTRTRALLTGSPAINAGKNTLIPGGVTTDQRGTGFPRILGGTVDIGAFELSTNSPPTVAAGAAAVSADEGGTLSNTGTFADPQGNNTVTLTAKVGGVPFGTVTKNDALGTWSWSAPALDGPAGPFTVTITATDNQSAAATATFTYAIGNVPPTISLSGNAEVNEGAEYTLNLGVVTDPGQDTITSYKINWGDGGIDTFGSLLNPASPANTTATHTYDDGPANQTHNVTVTDEDGTFLAGSLSVIVKNVDPTAAFASNGPITYGQTATVSFANQHDDSSTDTTAGFHYAYSTAPDFTGITYASTIGSIASHDYASLNAGDYTFYARIIDKDGGFTQYATNVTVDKASIHYTIGNDSHDYGSTANLAGDLPATFNTGVNGENLGIAYASTGNTATSNVGSYAITGTVSDGSGLASNYLVTLTPGNLAVNTKAISYTIGNATHVYGSTVNLAAALGTTIAGVNGENLAIAYSSTGNTATSNVGNYAITGVVSNATGLASNYTVTLTPGALTVTQKALTGDATTQDALNMAKQGLLKITISNVAGLLNGDTLATFLSTAHYFITIGANRYEFVPTSVTTSGSSITLSYTLKNSALLGEFGHALDAATSGATAISSGFYMESLNYTFTDDYLTRMFSTVK